MESIQQIVSLSRRHADIAITLTPPNGKRFVAEELAEYRLFIYASPQYRARHAPIRRREDLTEHLFAGYVDELLFTRELDYLDALGIPPRAVHIQNSSIYAQMEAVRSGLCLAVLPAFVAASRPELVRVLPETVNLSRLYRLVVSADNRGTRRTRHLCSLLRQEVEKGKALFLGHSDDLPKQDACSHDL
jgi:DNA-binding transcriptional LysR family regulator